LAMTWIGKRKKIREDIAEAFSSYTGISRERFLSRFFDSENPPTIGDFSSHYLPGKKTRYQILSTLAGKISLDVDKVENHYHRKETFPQFGEHLLRVGAYRK
jgi:hypothetical protein